MQFKLTGNQWLMILPMQRNHLRYLLSQNQFSRSYVFSSLLFQIHLAPKFSSTISEIDLSKAVKKFENFQGPPFHLSTMFLQVRFKAKNTPHPKVVFGVKHFDWEFSTVPLPSFNDAFFLWLFISSNEWDRIGTIR